MIATEIDLPNPNSKSYQQDLNWKLKQVLRDMANAINRTQGATWNGFHPILGQYHIWVSSTGVLRIKSSAPTSDGDGSAVGTQS